MYHILYLLQYKNEYIRLCRVFVIFLLFFTLKKCDFTYLFRYIFDLKKRIVFCMQSLI